MRLLRGLPICMAKSGTRARTESSGRPDGSGAGGGRATLPPRRRGWRPRPGRGRPEQPPNIVRPGAPAVDPRLARSRMTLSACHRNGDPCPDCQPDRKTGLVPVTVRPIRPDSVPDRRRIPVAQPARTDQVALGRWTRRPWGECRIRAAMRRFAQIVGTGWPRSVYKVIGLARCAAFQMEGVTQAARPVSPHPGAFMGHGGKRRGKASFTEPVRPAGGQSRQPQVVGTGGWL